MFIHLGSKFFNRIIMKIICPSTFHVKGTCSEMIMEVGIVNDFRRRKSLILTFYHCSHRGFTYQVAGLEGTCLVEIYTKEM